MAMSKKEKAAFEAAVRAAKMRGALRWTTPVAPDVPAPLGRCSPGTSVWAPVTGWSFNSYSHRVYPSYSTSTSHGEGPGTDKNRVSSQNSIVQYSTKALALRAMRHDMELQFAEALLRVDLMLEEEENPK